MIGLAVAGDGMGMLLPIEVSAVESKKGELHYGGICESETVSSGNRTITGKSSAKVSLDNVLTVLSELYSIPVSDYNITVNFPGGMPVDGPSAGIALFAACYSAIKKIGINNKIAFTGELSIMGNVNPVGGVKEKLEAAKNSGAKIAVIPMGNYYKDLERIGIKILPIRRINELTGFLYNEKENVGEIKEKTEVVAAAGR